MSQIFTLSILGIPRGVRTFSAKTEVIPRVLVRDIIPFTAFLHPLRQTELFLTQERVYKAHIVKDKIERLEF
jgi:hypothetical protein